MRARPRQISERRTKLEEAKEVAKERAPPRRAAYPRPASAEGARGATVRNLAV